VAASSYSIKYDTHGWPFLPDAKRASVIWEGYFFDVFAPSGEKLFRAAISRDDVQFPSRIADLNQQFGADAVNPALRRWAVRRIEQVLRDGTAATGGTLELTPGPQELDLIARLAGEKSCRHQKTEDGEIFCSAAAKDDPFVRGQSGARWLAVTTRPVCSACDLPDTDALCSHFMHPTIKGSATVTGYKRKIADKHCNLAREEISKNPSGCHPGGHSCWRRLVDLAVGRTSTSSSPAELPEALDFLNAIWMQAFAGKRLVIIKSAANAVGLVGQCSNLEEFSSRLSEVSDLFKLMNVDDGLLSPVAKPIDKSATFDRILAALNHSLPGHDKAAAAAAIKTLRAINKARWARQHSAATADLPDALAQLGISYPVEDYKLAWDVVRSRAGDAVKTLRKAIESALP